MNTRAMAAGLALVIAGAAWSTKAQESTPQPGDPLRWYRADVTPQDRYRTSMKEMAAALKEALQECRTRGPMDRIACEREAREQHRHDVALAKARLGQDFSSRG